MEQHKELIKPSYFSNSNIQSLIEMIMAFHAEYRRVPSDPTMREIIHDRYKSDEDSDRKRRNALEQTLDVLSSAIITDREFIDAKLRSFEQHCAIKATIWTVYESMQAGKYDPDLPDVLRRAIATGNARIDAGHDWVEQSEQRVRDYVSPDHNPRISTGLPHLDAMMDGGLKGGELGAFLAPPKGFKSGAMLNMAYAAMLQSIGINVVYVSLELSEELLGIRFDMRTTGWTKEDIRADPELFTEVLKEKQDVLFGGRSPLRIKEFKTKTANGDTIRSYLDHLYHHFDIVPGMVIVDYLDLLKGPRKREKDYLEAADAAEDLRSIASKSEYNVPIWTAVRATRDAVGKRLLNMSQLSKSFERAGIVDVLLALCMTEEDKLNGDLRIFMAATRNDAGDKVINCKVDFPTMRMKSVGLSDPEFEEDEPNKYSNSRRWEKEDRAPKEDENAPQGKKVRANGSVIDDGEYERRTNFRKRK